MYSFVYSDTKFIGVCVCYICGRWFKCLLGREVGYIYNDGFWLWILVVVLLVFCFDYVYVGVYRVRGLA